MHTDIGCWVKEFRNSFCTSSFAFINAPIQLSDMYNVILDSLVGHLCSCSNFFKFSSHMSHTQTAYDQPYNALNANLQKWQKLLTL